MHALLQVLLSTLKISTAPASPPPIQGFGLRVLPLGDSITFGAFSSHGNGYRKRIYDNLDGNDVTMIGSVASGSMLENHHEGHNGALIEAIAQFATSSLPEQPNIVLLHAGTNDIFIGDPAGAPTRLGSLIDDIFDTCPNTTALIAQIIGSTDRDVQHRIDSYNGAVPEIVKQRSDAGYHVLTIDMSHILDSSTDYSDAVHPNDAGYEKMATAWYQGLVIAEKMGWIKNASTDP